MTDDQRDQQDQQDRRLAEALAVPPLDELTRRRLVRNALDAVEDQQRLLEVSRDDGFLAHLQRVSAELKEYRAKAGWWKKAVQLDLEAKGVIVREKV